jgi:signal-transduction protein with cAMP-binding, CBS, and nucleotidyltransferase domain
MFYNKSVNILIVKDITIERKSDITNFDFQKLVSTLNIGFFRATIDFKGKFIFANETTLRILGFNNFRELSEVYILELLANAEDRKNLRKDLLENGVIKNKALKIQKKNGELAIVSVTLIVFNNNNSKDLICDGIIEDITLKEKEKSEKESLIVQLRAGNFIIEQPVKDYIIPAFSLGLDTTISEVICTLKNRKSDSVLIAKNEKEYIGFVTNSDIQNRVLALELNLDNPVYLIMSSPIIYINENSLIIDALNLCDEKKISHLVVKNDRDIVTGIFRMNDVYRFLKRSLSFFIENIKYSPSTEEIKNNYRMLMHLLKPIINSDISVKDITQITTTFSDAVNKRVVELAIQETGEPPVPFSLICLGSEGRKEETLLTDQDNAIIYDDVPKENEAEINNYFLSLGNKICTYLNDVGYSYCRGNIMAMNSQWCKPVSVWENYFLNWITTPEPQNLLDATIFFDFRIVYGDEELTGRLRNFINKLVNSQPLFLYHLAYNTYNIKCQQIAEKSTESIDLKNAVSLLVMFVRTYSLKYNINHTNTIDRLNSLIANQAIHTSTSSEILYVYNYLMKLRFKNQQFLADNNLPLSNILNPKRLIEIEQSVLKKVLSLIPAYQNKIGNDFRINI